MGITKFIFLLLVLSIIFLLYDKETKKEIIKFEEKPLLSFENSTMYEISTKGVSKIIKLEQALIYDTYENLINVSIIFKNENEKIINKLTANHITKVGDELFLLGDVHLKNKEKFNLRTEELQYNIKKQIIKNDAKFILVTNGNKFEGRGLFIDKKNSKIIAKDMHVKWKIKDTNEIK